MTRDEILAMPAGREMDEMIARKVINRKIGIRAYDRRLPHYSTDIAAAWEVAEKLGSFWIDHTVSDLGIDVEFFTSLDHSKERLVATADTAPLAICRAALLAVMEDENV